MDCFVASLLAMTEAKSRVQSTKLPDGQINSDFQKSCQAQKSIRIENISLFPKGKSGAHLCHPVPLRGASAIVTNEGRVAVDVEVPVTNGAIAYGEDVWS
jgi:hypothetical protein